MVLIEIGGFGMECFKCFGGLPADIGTGDFRFVVAPGNNEGADALGGFVCVAFRAADAQAGRIDTGMQLLRVEAFAGALALTFDDINGQA